VRIAAQRDEEPPRAKYKTRTVAPQPRATSWEQQSHCVRRRGEAIRALRRQKVGRIDALRRGTNIARLPIQITSPPAIRTQGPRE
jgi:hypothetical protein